MLGDGIFWLNVGWCNLSRNAARCRMRKFVGQNKQKQSASVVCVWWGSLFPLRYVTRPPPCLWLSTSFPEKVTPSSPSPWFLCHLTSLASRKPTLPHNSFPKRRRNPPPLPPLARLALALLPGAAQRSNSRPRAPKARRASAGRVLLASWPQPSSQLEIKLMNKIQRTSYFRAAEN